MMSVLCQSTNLQESLVKAKKGLKKEETSNQKFSSRANNSNA